MARGMKLELFHGGEIAPVADLRCKKPAAGALQTPRVCVIAPLACAAGLAGYPGQSRQEIYLSAAIHGSRHDLLTTKP